jgi:hypothetical protein
VPAQHDVEATVTDTQSADYHLIEELWKARMAEAYLLGGRLEA